jgi:hypothetical protein
MFQFIIDEQPQNLRNFENQQKVDAEFNVWTRNDCQGTPYSNGNRYIILKNILFYYIKF